MDRKGFARNLKFTRKNGYSGRFAIRLLLMVWIAWLLLQYALVAVPLIRALLQRLQKADEDRHQKTIKAPSMEYELTRRRVVDGTREMWYFFNAELKQLQKLTEKNAKLQAMVNATFEQGLKLKRRLLRDAQKLADVDGYNEWREKESKELSDIIQSRLHILQHPPNCSIARKLVCNINRMCGFGCQSNYVAFCLIVAYASQRTLILVSKDWSYHKQGFEDIFLPLSSTCTNTSMDINNITETFPNDAAQEVHMPMTLQFPHPTNYKWLPPSVPGDIASRLARIHGNPIAWWIGQLMIYLYRPNNSTQHMLKEAAEQIQFQKPVVGVHVRRTDKLIAEAAFHPIEEYMEHVEEYYNQLEMVQRVDVRRVYLATDDPAVHKEAREKYPQYTFLGNSSIALKASVNTRYSSDSFMGLLQDIFFLAHCDYFVCTLSSTAGRLVFEIMQALHPDASERFRSLDDFYYITAQRTNDRVAVMDHKARRPEEFNLTFGDLIGVAGNHWNGFTSGRNNRTDKKGLFPSHKVIMRVEPAEFTIYNETDGSPANQTVNVTLTHKLNDTQTKLPAG